MNVEFNYTCYNYLSTKYHPRSMKPPDFQQLLLCAKRRIYAQSEDHVHFWLLVSLTTGYLQLARLASQGIDLLAMLN